MSKQPKEPTIFDVFNKMPLKAIDLFYHTRGGRQVGKAKDKKAVIEVLVDNDTFQDFAFQKTYGHPKDNKKKKFFVMLSVDYEEYELQRANLNKKMQNEQAR